MNTSIITKNDQTHFALPTAPSPCFTIHEPNHEQTPATPLNPKSEPSGARPAAEGSPQGERGSANQLLNPKFPTALLPKPLRALTQGLAHACHLPEAHVASTGLALLSAAIGSGATLTHGPHLTRPNLFFLLLSEDSANATTAFRHAAAPLFDSHHEFEQQMLTESEPQARHELAPLRRQRRALLAEEYPHHHNQQLLALEEQIQTNETFLHRDHLDVVTHIPRGRLFPRLLAQPHGLALLNPDARHAAAAFCANPGSQAATDESALLAGHRGLPVLTDRKIKQLHYTPAPCLTVLWSLRPTDWQQLAQNPRTATSPILPRFLILNSALALNVAASGSLRANLPSQNQHPFSGGAPLSIECSASSASARSPQVTIGDVGCSQWPTTLTTLLDWKIEEDPIPCTLDAEATTLLHAYETELLATPDPDFGTHHHFADHAYRLTLLLHLADHAGYVAAHEAGAEDPAEDTTWTETISASTAARAITLLRWYHQHQQPILETLHQQPDPDLEKITKWLTRAGGQMTLNDLRRHHNFHPHRISSLVEAYPDLLRLDDDPKTTPGRKSQFLTLISLVAAPGRAWINRPNSEPTPATTPPPLSPISPFPPECECSDPESAHSNGSAAAGTATACPERSRRVPSAIHQSAQRPTIEPSPLETSARPCTPTPPPLSPIPPISPIPIPRT